MSMLEKVSYLKGLADGLDINKDSSEGKLLLAIVDVLGEMAEEVTAIGDTCDELDELVDILDEDLGNLEEDFYEDCDCDCEDDEELDDDLYEVTCPKCDDTVYLTEDMILEGSIECPNCGEEIEFDLSGCCCDDDDCDCGCDHDHE